MSIFGLAILGLFVGVMGQIIARLITGKISPFIGWLIGNGIIILSTLIYCVLRGLS